MAFRADEAATRGYDEVRNYLVSRHFTTAQRTQSEKALRAIIEEVGPPVDSYPTWHPLVAQHDGRDPETHPSERTGYKGLDHTRYFAHGFITCPYVNGDEVIASAHRIKCPPGVSISAERLDAPFYIDNADPILVRCEWARDLEVNHTIPKALAVPLMLEQEVPCWHWSQRAETWETMRPYLLGQPHGSRSSLFVTQDTALAIKKIYISLVESGMFGPLKLG
ncbi:hypothetical protein [Sphingobium sp. MK2]|uniref:hypothetical protein n=1 Tax=Sphingobium sp. MK2 TaxID=3116540 RepID=UPI0032E35CA6